MIFFIRGKKKPYGRFLFIRPTFLIKEAEGNCKLTIFIKGNAVVFVVMHKCEEEEKNEIIDGIYLKDNREVKKFENIFEAV